MNTIRILFKDGSTFTTEGRIVYAGDGGIAYVGRLGKVREVFDVERVWQGRI